ncbi:MAG: hypothetical protein LUC22_05670 [Prevotella sp.]|nr:hypothetical protein [Prevotella sp.]
MNAPVSRKTAVLLFLLAALIPSKVLAQWTFDVVSVEAYINDHKKQRSLLLARSILEYSNKLLHDYSSEKTVDYKDLNAELDKYTRAFDIIDVLYQSLRTCLNVYSAYESVSNRISDYKSMLEDYKNKVVARNRIEAADTVIITINAYAIEKIAGEAEHLYKSVSELALYVTGLAACSTADLLIVLDAVNLALNNIESYLNSAYIDTWRYIQLRIGYWKGQVYSGKTKEQLVKEAFARWRTAGKINH